ncbi:MAG: LamG domain-containing protein [Candidatus Brocadiae bacterium]|nr:LamG domain-containing protein [Candidatus Brocadiia bacterium]
MKKYFLCLFIVCFSLLGEGIDSYTDLYLNGENFIDQSTYHRSVSTYGNTQVVNNIYQFGNGSYRFDGTGDFVYYNIGTVTYPYTVDFWLRVSSYNSYNTFWGVESKNMLQIQGQKIILSSGTSSVTHRSNTTINLNTWYHLGLVMTSQTSGSLFINGQKETLNFNSSSTGGYGTQGLPTTGNMFFGTYDGWTEYGLNGYIDEIRVSKGIARWDSNFVVPGVSYQNPVPEPCSLILSCIGLLLYFRKYFLFSKKGKI